LSHYITLYYIVDAIM